MKSDKDFRELRELLTWAIGQLNELQSGLSQQITKLDVAQGELNGVPMQPKDFEDQGEE